MDRVNITIMEEIDKLLLDSAGILPKAERSGTPGIHTDIPVSTPPADQNPNGRNIHNPKVKSLLSKLAGQAIDDDSELQRYSKAIDNVLGKLGISVNLNDYTQASFWINKILKSTAGKLLGPQASGLDKIMGFTPTNQDIISYYKHLSLNGDNYARIAFDLLMRLVTIPTNLYKSKLKRAIFTGEEIAAPINGTSGNLLSKSTSKLLKGGARKLQYKANDAIHLAELQAFRYGRDAQAALTRYLSEVITPIPQNFNDTGYSDAGDIRNAWNEYANYYGYDIQDDELVERIKAFNTIINKSLNGNHLIEECTPGKDKENYYQGNRDLWITKDGTSYEMSDNFYWGVKVVPYDKTHTLLPKFPDEFNSGWWPIIGCSYTKYSLQSKSFSIPFFNLELPVSSERPSKLKLSLLDNSRRSMQSWLESYIREVFDIDQNIVLPYKNLLLDLTVYRYDMTLSTLFQGEYLGLISTHNIAFNGDSSHTQNEIELNLEIVGEVPSNFRIIKYRPYSHEDNKKS